MYYGDKGIHFSLRLDEKLYHYIIDKAISKGLSSSAFVYKIIRQYYIEHPEVIENEDSKPDKYDQL